jgi:hypothetical protein
MGERITLFAVLLVMPLFALGVGYLIESRYESKWRAVVQQQIPISIENSSMPCRCEDTAGRLKKVVKCRFAVGILLLSCVR